MSALFGTGTLAFEHPPWLLVLLAVPLVWLMARRSLAEELQHQLTCTEAQLAISKSVDDRLGRKERRRLREAQHPPN